MEIFSKLFSKLKNLKQNSLYWMIGGIVFFLGILYHFPLEHFGSALTSNIQKQTGFIVQMEKISLTFPIGIYAQNVQVVPSQSDGQSPPTPLHLDSLTLRPSVLSILFYPIRKSFGFSYKAIRGKEIWSGSASLGQKNSEINIKAKNFELDGVFPLDKNPMFAGMFAPGRTASVAGTFDIEFSIAGKTIEFQQQNFSNSEGLLNIAVKKMNIKIPMLSMQSYSIIDKELSFSDANLESSLKKGTLNIKKIEMHGSILDGTASGDIKVAPFFPDSRINLEVKAKINSDPDLDSLLKTFESANNINPASDGTLSVKIEGPLTSVSVRNL